MKLSSCTKCEEVLIKQIAKKVSEVGCGTSGLQGAFLEAVGRQRGKVQRSGKLAKLSYAKAMCRRYEGHEEIVFSDQAQYDPYLLIPHRSFKIGVLHLQVFEGFLCFGGTISGERCNFRGSKAQAEPENGHTVRCSVSARSRCSWSCLARFASASAAHQTLGCMVRPFAGV